ncbi:MAG TPA: hypothetical protein VHB20_04175 [Verrucomicrobiae bacterium]|jgi:GntP family gluconate:H+ symporter|nr:hypothetical protein [Verrucomicrobiae bacterium]
MPNAGIIDQAAPSMTWPFVILIVSVIFVMAAISKFRVHPFLALISAALLAGVMSERLPGPNGTAAPNHWVRAVELTTEEFGKTAGVIGISIGLAAVIAVCLMESGAADKVVRRFLGFFGPKRAGLALLTSTYILAIPIFFDTMFMLMAPLAMVMAVRTGKNYVLYLMAICGGGAITHVLVVPHPGPLGMVENLKLDPGFCIAAGILAGIIPAFVGYAVSTWINRRLNLGLPSALGLPVSDLDKIEMQPESELPPFVASILPVILPVALISLASLFNVIGNASYPTAAKIAAFVGNKNIALLIGTLLAIILLARQKRMSLGQISILLEPSMATAAVCILIVSASGAFGSMLKNAGVGLAIQHAATGRAINLVALAYVIALVLRVAQGSSTVSMLTTSSMLAPMVLNHDLPFHPIYVFLAISFGSLGASWMNDSGFWVVSKISGLTERQTLASWSVLATVISVSGFLVVWAFSFALPLK